MNSSIIDSFPYAGEKTILDLRFHELYNVVSKFLIIESNRTQTGLEKPYYFEKQKNSYKKFQDKIVYVKLDDSILDKKGGVAEADWSHEFRVRQAIQKDGFDALENSGLIILPDTVLLVSDCDEIPKASSILDFVKSGRDLISFNHYFNSYYLNLYSRFREPWGWFGTIGIRCGSLTNNGIQYLRNMKDHLPHTGLEGEGWHFSSLLCDGFNSLYEKWLRNIEPHNKDSIKGEENKKTLEKEFNKCLYEDMNFFFCDRPDKREIKLEELNFELLPDYVKQNKEKFKNLLYSKEK